MLRRNRAPTTSQNTMLSSRPAQGKMILLLICNLDTACRHVAYHQKQCCLWSACLVGTQETEMELMVWCSSVPMWFGKPTKQ